MKAGARGDPDLPSGLARGIDGIIDDFLPEIRQEVMTSIEGVIREKDTKAEDERMMAASYDM